MKTLLVLKTTDWLSCHPPSPSLQPWCDYFVHAQKSFSSFHTQTQAVDHSKTEVFIIMC